jgi:hypothetical protein
MNRIESGYSERVGARISPELKAHLQDVVQDGRFDSEADLVREALWHYVEHGTSDPVTAASAKGADPVGFEDRAEWLLTVLLILIGMVSSRVLNTLRVEQVKPAELVDEAIQEAVYNRTILWTKLRAGRRAAQRFEDHQTG